MSDISLPLFNSAGEGSHTVPNQDTRETRTFDYMENSGVPRTCRATESHVAGLGQHDSQWEVKKPESDHWDGPYDWLTYMPPDGVQAHIKFHMESGGGTWGMNVWLENERLNGEHNDNFSSFPIFDWDGTLWKVSIPSVVRQNPWTPTFDLRRM